MHCLGRMRRFLAMGMLAAVLLSGCGSTGEGSYAGFEQLTEEETEEETMAQKLQKQIIAVLNVRGSLEDRITSDADLEQAAAFFLEYLLQNPDMDLTAVSNPTNLNGMLIDLYTYAFVYDGELSAVQTGEKILADLKKLTESNEALKVRVPQSVAIVHGEEGEKSAWLVLIHYSVDEVDTGEEGSQKPGGTGSAGSGNTGDTDASGNTGTEGTTTDPGTEDKAEP